MITTKRYRKFSFFIILFLVCYFLTGQTAPVAKFTFNDGKDYDEVSGNKAKLINIAPAKDRFGNDNHAVFISGSSYSYINLGTYKSLKPTHGTIAMWFKLDGFIYSGKGEAYNPLLLTKQTSLDDFYESYAIYYFHLFKKLVFISSRDSLLQTIAYSKENEFISKWFHVAITFDNTALSIYVNGKHEGSMPRNYETTYLDADSVMVGHTANKKNQRYTAGSVDDVEFYDRVLTGTEINDLYNAPNPNKNAVFYKWLMIVLAVAGFLALLYFYIRYRVNTAVKIEKQRSEQANVALENELRIHRALMNPHFIFNTLNGLQDLILKKEYDGANDYLIKFSQLLRKILESNMADVISLEQEIELLTRYIEIEAVRFEENFSYAIKVDPKIVPSTTVIPIMMLQIFVENSIWHGLLPKDGDKSIAIAFELYDKKYLKCVIEDNGVGRKTRVENMKKKSLATIFIRQRLELLNKIHNLRCSLLIEDRTLGEGTRVTIILPILNG